MRCGSRLRWQSYWLAFRTSLFDCTLAWLDYVLDVDVIMKFFLITFDFDNIHF